MQTVLTSWKAIARYLDRGVRTVQRWEAQFGFPVRRPTSGGHRTVVAIAEEIDAWLASQTPKRHSELQRLRAEVESLRAEVERLRAELRKANA